MSDIVSQPSLSCDSGSESLAVPCASSSENQVTLRNDAKPGIASGKKEDSTKADRSSDRFVVTENGALLNARLTFCDGSVPNSEVVCQIADLHLGGCALRYQTSKALSRRTALMHLQIPDLDLKLHILGAVRWSRQTGMGTFTSGFQFRQPLPCRVIQSMLREDKITRRIAPRVSTDLPVQVRQSAPPLSLDNSRIISVSKTGVQLVTQEPLELKSRLLLRMPCGATAVATTVWCVLRENDFASGATFLAADQGRKFFTACQ